MIRHEQEPTLTDLDLDGATSGGVTSLGGGMFLISSSFRSATHNEIYI